MSFTSNYVTRDDLLDYEKRFCICYWGDIALFCRVKLASSTFKYEVINNMKKVYETNYISDAIEEYNKLCRLNRGFIQ